MRGRKRALKEKLKGKVGESLKETAENKIKELNAKPDLTDKEAEELGMYEEYLMARGIQYINTKRENRSLFKIGLALTNMAADIAVLAGGSAPVGVAFKGAAAATDASAGLLRRFKQWGRNKAAAGSGLAKFMGFDANVDRQEVCNVQRLRRQALCHGAQGERHAERRQRTTGGRHRSREERLRLRERYGYEQGRSRLAVHHAVEDAGSVDRKDEGA